MTDGIGTSVAGAQLAGSVSTDTARLGTKDNLQAAGQQFEAIFDGMMLKSMRAPHLAEDIFGSKAQDTFRDMQDSELAKSMAAHAPIGIGKAMTDFLSKAQASLQADASAAAGASGGAATGSATP